MIWNTEMGNECAYCGYDGPGTLGLCGACEADMERFSREADEERESLAFESASN